MVLKSPFSTKCLSVSRFDSAQIPILFHNNRKDKMKILKNVALTLVVIVALMAVIGFFLPSKWETSASMSMKAPCDRIYPHVADLKKWQGWSPWTTEKDPTLTYTYTGPESGVDAQSNWTSKSMGTGWMKITKADSMSGVTYDLFINMGFESTLQGSIGFEKDGDMTKVTWTDKGDAGNNIIMKWMALFMGSTMKGELESGLAKLKGLVEA